MKKIFLTLCAVALSAAVFAQTSSLPNTTLKDMDGNTVETAKLSNDGKPMLICFWATWCSPCKKELNTYAEYYDQWKEETGVKIYAITIDDQRTVNSVKPYVNSVAWEYEILSDGGSGDNSIHLCCLCECSCMGVHVCVRCRTRLRPP